MKPTIRVSIGGLAFNLEEDAYQIFDNYLQALKNHFQGNAEADEIIADIESRISELMQMRIDSSDNVVSETEAREIIKIMGNPKDFDDTFSGDADSAYTPPEGNLSDVESASDPLHDIFKKKLFRDVDNKMIAGVCSGLGHYFKIDLTAVRLIFLGVLFLLYFISFKAAFVLVLIYVILWAVMPTAKTFVQKLSMTGADPSIENIEDRLKTSSRKYKGSSVGSVLGTIINIIVGFGIVINSLILVAIVATLVWLHFDTEIVAFNNYLLLFGYNTINFKIAIVLLLIVPLIGFISLLVKILRRSQFTTHTLVFFIVGLVFWLGAGFYLANRGIKFGYAYQDRAEVVKDIPIDTSAETLYVKLGEEYLDARLQPNQPMMLYKGSNMARRQICILPRIKIEEDTLLTNYKVEVVKRSFGDNTLAAKRKAEALHLNYNLADSVLTINPQWYGRNKPYDMTFFDIIITSPRNKKVEVETLLQESCNINSTHHHNYDFFNSYNDFDFD